MNQIKQIISKVNIEDKSIKRFEVEYDESKNKQIWFGVAKEYIQNITLGDHQRLIWNNLIQYVHGRKESIYDLDKAICIVGQTGSGKTQTLQIMNKYIEIGKVNYIRHSIVMPFTFRIITANEIASQYSLNGYDGIQNYLTIGNLCIDDLGNEPERLNHYGTKLDVLTEIIETRYNKGLLTHFTTNLSENEIETRYNSRVYSRIKHSCNIIVMNDKDFRL